MRTARRPYQGTGTPGWLDVSHYNRAPALTAQERRAFAPLGVAHGWGGRTTETILAELGGAARIVLPLRDAMNAIEGNPYWKERALVALLRGCLWEDSAFWGWDSATWSRLLAADTTRLLTANHPNKAGATRHYMIAAAYVLGCLVDRAAIVNVEWHGIARKVFGQRIVDEQIGRIDLVVDGWGYTFGTRRALRGVTARAMLNYGSTDLSGMTLDALDSLRREHDISTRRKGLVSCLSRALVQLGVLATALPMQNVQYAQLRETRSAGMAPEWAQWVDRWEATSTQTPKTRASGRNWLLKVGRWLHEQHPDITGPEQWTREIAADAVAAIDRMRGGEYTSNTNAGPRSSQGRPLAPRSKAAALHMLSLAFRDSQDWEWIPRRFNASRAFATPRSISALIAPAPRTIADDVWAKLMWAGLNLSQEDMQTGTASTPSGRSPHYPLEFIRALTIVWLFAGLRSDEILRLQVGCVRWQVANDDDTSATKICLLDVPVHKTGRPYTKPVDPLVGEAIAAWEAVRGTQPLLPDRKTGEPVALLFCHRARRTTGAYLNNHLIPMLCHKAGVPLADAKGAITSHRARATIASQLYNAKDPMTLFELQAWLGHSSPASTQHYALITPNTLTKAYRDAGYFARNVRAIEVLVDRDAIQNGAAAAGTPWQYYDLGHGYCTYSFFEQCPHRMACARCDFYVPKESSKAQLLESKEHLQHMVATIPLTDDEKAAAGDDAAAVERLLQRLADVPTPAGPTPRALGFTPLPVIPSR
jgi:integrase